MPRSMYRLKNAPSTSSRENPQVIWVRSLVPKEKNSADLAISAGGQRGPRHLDHRADRGLHVHSGLRRDLCEDPLGRAPC